MAFRPLVDGFHLEDRVVLAGSLASTAAMLNSLAASPVGGSAAAQTGLGNMTMNQIRTAYTQQFRAAGTSLRQAIDTQISALYAKHSNIGTNGRPTAAALANFNANVAGAVNASALRLSSQASLLPGSNRLVSSIQSSLLGSQGNSLTSRISQLTSSTRFTRSQPQLQNAINRVVNTSFADNTARLRNFFQNTPLRRLSVDAATGQQVPLSQFLGNRAVQQINNTFGSLANSVSPNARAALFNSSGVFNPQGVSAFQRQFNNAVGTAAFQVGNVLSLFPNAQSTLGPQLQSGLFATGNNPATGRPNTSLVNGLSGLFPSSTNPGTSPFTSGAFNTGFQNAFTTAFRNITSPINTFFGTPTVGTGGSQLPAGFFQTGATFPSTFGSQFTGSSFNGGFNNGFATTGTGFPGFGTAPTGFNSGFGTGFNNLVNTLNTQFGFTQPTIGVGSGTGTTGGGTTGTVGGGTGTIGGGTGTVGGGTGAVGVGTGTIGGGIGTIGGGTGTIGGGTGTIGGGIGTIGGGTGTIGGGIGTIGGGTGTIGGGTGTVGVGTGTVGLGTGTVGVGTWTGFGVGTGTGMLGTGTSLLGTGTGLLGTGGGTGNGFM